jgi:outer membrane protein TolC
VDLLARATTVQPGVADFIATERSNAALILDQSRQSAELAIASLRQQLRLGSDQPIRLTTKLGGTAPIPPVDRLNNLADANRSDIRQSEIRLRQARIAQSQATDYRRPSLRVSAFASHAISGSSLIPHWADLGRAKSAGVALSFNLPIWSYDGGELGAVRRIASIQAEQALADTDEAKERARNEISAELIGINRARTRIEKAPDPAQARQSLQRAEEQMLSAPAADAPALLAQVSNARQNWRAATMLKFDALTAFYVEYFRLQRSLGTDAVE